MSVGLSNPGMPSAHNLPSGPIAQPNPAMMNPSSMPNMNGGAPMPPAGPQQSAGFPTLDFGAPTQQGQPTQQYQAPGFQPQSVGNVMPQQPFVPPAPQAPQQVLGGQSLTAGQFQPQPMPQYQPQYAPAPGVTAAPAYLPQVQQAPQYGMQPAAPPTTLLRDSMVRQGYSVGHYASDEELSRDLGSIAERGLNAQRELEAIQQRLAWTQSQQGAPQPNQPQGQGTAPNQPTQPAGPQREQAPEWDPQWDSLVRLDPQTNTYVPINAHVNPQLATRANEVASWRRKRSAALLANPIEVIAPDLEEREKKLRSEVLQEVRNELQAERRNAEADAAIKDYTTKNAAAFVQMDQNGKPVVNSINGQVVLTPKGQAFYAHVTGYKQQFQATYGREPDRLDVLRHVQQQLAADEAMGKFGPPQQPQVPGAPQMPGYPQQFAPQVPGQFVPQVTPQFPAAPQMPTYGGQSLAAYNPYMPAQYGAQPQQFMQPQTPQYPTPVFGPQPMAPMQSPQDAMVARAIANNAGYQPQPNGTIVANYLNPLVPQSQNLDLRQMFAQEVQARGLPTDAFTS